MAESVQPLESVETKKAPKPKGERCWNCKNQGQKNYLEDGICEVCGFDKNLLYNGNIEADRTAQRIEANRKAEQEFLEKRAAELLGKG